MDSRSFLSIFSIIFLYLSLHFPSKVEAKSPISTHPNKLLIEVCKQSNVNFKFCMQFMKSNPRIFLSRNIRTIANYALAVARKESIIARNLFNRLAGVSKNSTAELKDCANYFNETIGMLNLNGLEGGTASLDVHYAFDNCRYCEIALGSAKVHSGLINATINKWKNYYSVAYSTVVIIENQTPSGSLLT